MREAMGYDVKTVERARQMLAGRSDVVEKRMIGGLSFMVNGSMCCGVTSEGLMVRVGPEAREGALALAHVRPMEFGGRALAGFVLVEPEGYQDDAALAAWVQRGVEFAVTLPVKTDGAKKRSRES